MKIFITGSSRSGTTMMSRILGNNKAVFTFQELHFFDELISPGNILTIPDTQTAVKLYARLCAIQRNGYFGSHDTGEFLNEAQRVITGTNSSSYLKLYETFLHRETDLHERKIPCEQTPQNIFALHEILTHFKESKVIIMVRDPREVLLSQKNKWKRRKLSGGKIPLREAIRVRINYHPVTISKLWNSVMHIANKYINHPSVLLVRYEDLLADPEQVIRKLCSHCQIGFNEKMLDIPVVGSSNFLDSNTQRGIDASKKSQWKKGGLNNTEIFICQKINRTVMKQYDYLAEPVAPNPLPLAWYYLSLPFQLALALLFNLKRLRSLMKLWGRG